MKTLPKPFIAILAAILAMNAAACRSTAPNFSESIAEKSQARIKARKYKENPNHNWQTFDLLSSSIAVFLLRTSKEIPNSIMEKIESLVVSGLHEGQLFDTILTPRETRTRFSDNKILAQKKSIYLDSLSTIAISDKDISHPMGRYLEVDSFFIFQIDNWPCPDCILKDRIRMKIRLIDAISGDIVWTGIDELHSVTDRSEDTYRLAIILAEDLIENFHLRFKRKWHQKRYTHLATLAP